MNLYSPESRDQAMATLVILGWKRINNYVLLRPSNFLPDSHIFIDRKTNQFYFFTHHGSILPGDNVTLHDKEEQLKLDGALIVDIVIENTDDSRTTC